RLARHIAATLQKAAPHLVLLTVRWWPCQAQSGPHPPPSEHIGRELVFPGSVPTTLSRADPVSFAKSTPKALSLRVLQWLEGLPGKKAAAMPVQAGLRSSSQNSDPNSSPGILELLELPLPLARRVAADSASIRLLFPRSRGPDGDQSATV